MSVDEQKRRPADPPRTIRQLADAIGVSKSTVSLALSGTEEDCPLASDTRRKVIEAAARLGFRPNRAARSLARNRSHCVGLLYASRGPGYTGIYGELIHALAECLAARGLDLLLIPAVGDEAEWSGKLIDRRIDGCVVMQPAPRGIAGFLQRHDVPAVVMNDACPGPIHRFLFDEHRHVAEIVAHLHGLGHRRFGWLSESVPEPHYALTERRAALRELVAAAGDGSTCTDLPGEDADSAAAAWRGMPPDRRPTAVVVYRDETAHHLLRELHRGGVGVPAEVSVVGFNDIRASATSPVALTTVRFPVWELAWRAVERLTGPAAEGERVADDGSEERLSGSLVVRETTGLAPG